MRVVSFITQPRLIRRILTPGAYGIRVLVEDNSGYADAISAYVVATPGP